jgi:hypothetical protein
LKYDCSGFFKRAAWHVFLGGARLEDTFISKKSCAALANNSFGTVLFDILV